MDNKKLGENVMLHLINPDMGPEPKNDIKILIADDDNDMREVLKEYLNKTGCWVQCAKDGIEAIEMLEKQDYSYEIVITDLNMPKCNGIDVVKAAKENNPDSHVIIITGYGTLESAIEAIRLGAYDYITKPFKMEEIGILMENLLKKIYLIRENRALLKRLRNAYSEMEELYESKKRMEEMLDRVNDGLENCQREFAEDLDTIIPKNANNRAEKCFFPSKQDDNQAKLINELEKLGELKGKGLLTEEEFIASKKSILNLK